MNPLTNILPAKFRKYAYAAYAFVGLGLGAVPVYCAATDATTPIQVVGALAVYAFVGAPLFGATAASNTPTTQD
jgi:hypothetical protein